MAYYNFCDFIGDANCICLTISKEKRQGLSTDFTVPIICIYFHNDFSFIESVEGTCCLSNFVDCYVCRMLLFGMLRSANESPHCLSRRKWQKEKNRVYLLCAALFTDCFGRWGRLCKNASIIRGFWRQHYDAIFRNNYLFA